MENKSAQLQIRVSESQKSALRRQAKRAGLSMSDWVLNRVLPPVRETFQELLKALSVAEKPGYVLAEFNEFLTRLTVSEFKLAVSERPQAKLDDYWRNYVAATIEYAAASKRVQGPSWTHDVQPLEDPVFGSTLKSLRLHLLTNSPPPFRSRNIFIDSSIGDRV
jgi:hypothetical protein